MAHSNKTAYLNDEWDIELEKDGSIKMCSDEIYAVMQNCCNEIRLWLRDAYFRYDQGTDYQHILASKYNKIRLVTAFKQAIHRVSTEIEIKDIIIDDIDTESRKVTGTIKIVYGGQYGEYNF